MAMSLPHHVQEGKSRKDREIELSPVLLEELRQPTGRGAKKPRPRSKEASLKLAKSAVERG
jgi:hypothetical protein